MFSTFPLFSQMPVVLISWCNTRLRLLYLLNFFFQAGTVMNPTIRLVLCTVRIFLALTTVTVKLAWVVFLFYFVWELGLINASLDRRPRAPFSRTHHSFSLYGPTLNRQIRYIFSLARAFDVWRGVALRRKAAQKQWTRTSFALIISVHPYCARNSHATSCIEGAR